MAIADKHITETHEKVRLFLNKLEECHALAANIAAEYTALGGSNMDGFAAYPWPNGLTATDFTNAITTLGSIGQHLLTQGAAGHDTNLYKIKQGLG